ncbi:MAG TPA: hypothetical protein VNT92_01500 [Acidimicrobiia bacterium]|nr:hypothetical protein [Acidimicrobiia bacterium]
MPTRVAAAASFGRIRSWEGSQARAFEELCFQLRDSAPAGAELVKTGDPDAGVEWYWRFSDGVEFAWQSKFVFATAGLLSQMRDSLKSAVKKRKGLQRMTFCIPYDLADDPSRARGKQARQRFDEAKVRWREFAPGVEVDLLSGGQLLERLALEEHRGREFFFFGERLLGSEWCERELSGTIEDAGDRYTPQQDVALPIDEILEAVAQTPELEGELRLRIEATLLVGNDLLKHRDPLAPWAAGVDAIEKSLTELEMSMPICELPPSIESGPALTAVKDGGNAIAELEADLYPQMRAQSLDREERGGMTKAEKAVLAKEEELARAASSLARKTRKLSNALGYLKRFLRGPACQAAERRALFVHGPAGRGKTHLFCDVGERLLAQGHPVLVLLGERFREGSVWRTLAAALGEPNLSPDEVAGVLAASGEASGRRAVLLIDAINETKPDPGVWAAELSDMRRRLSTSGWVGFAVSCRDTYLDLVEPEGGPDKKFARVEHLGYRGREHEATEKIFAVHGLVAPQVPLLLPEFSDPLFLKLYCEGLKASGAVPSGSEHLSEVFETFVKARGERVERTLRLDRGLEVVRRAIAALASELVARGGERIPYAEAAYLINELAPHLGESPETLFEQLVSEGLVSVDRVWIEDRDELGEAVGFPYQRFSDHLIVGAYLDSKLAGAGPEEVAAAFGMGGHLEQWLDGAPLGQIEALAVALPERWQVELPDLYPQADGNEVWERQHFALPYFLSSIVVRDREAFGPRASELLNDCLKLLPSEALDALISISADPRHPYNGSRLHAFLAAMPMAERDAYWGIETYHSFENPATALDRLIRWAARGPYQDYSDEVLELACLPMIWLLGSPNRFARDYTTKALASVLIGRPELCGALVDRFAAIDDPYITERLTAAVAGSVMRSPAGEIEARAAQDLLEKLIVNMIETPGAAPDLLKRDHIASLARLLRRHKQIPPRLLRRAVPPYESKPPKRPRSAKHLKETYPAGEHGSGYQALHFSALSDWSDWSRYEVSGRIDKFLPTKLGEPIPAPEKPDPLDDFKISKAGWRRFEKTLKPDQLELIEDEGTSAAGLFIESLDEEQLQLLSKAYVPNRRSRAPRRIAEAIPLERAGRLIFQRCIELGWTPERFGNFDDLIGRRGAGRESHKAERFGKKYQWIALHELLARLTDNFILMGWQEADTYEGAWQLGLVRDIDPSLPPEPIRVDEDQEHTRSPTFGADQAPSWWTAEGPAFEKMESGTEASWADRLEEMPTPEKLLRVRDPEGRAWMIVDGFHSWSRDSDQIASVSADPEPRRDLTIRTLGAVIRSSSVGVLRKWLEDDADLLRAMPDWRHQSIHEAFWSELPDEAVAHERPAGWRPVRGEGQLPVRSAAVALSYGAESSGFDCSLSEGLSIDLPSIFMVKLVGGRWSEAERMWVDRGGRPFAQFRQTNEGFGHDRALLFEEELLGELLAGANLALAIGLFSERRVFKYSTYGGSSDMLGWTDYGGHLIIDGKDLISAPMVAIERQRGNG